MSERQTLYKQIYDHLKRDIQMDKYGYGTQLPTERELIESYGVSRITVRKALACLEEDGLISRYSGKGSFVRGERKTTEKIMRPKPMIALVMGSYSSSFGYGIISGAVKRSQELDLHLILKCSGYDQQKETRICEELVAAGVSGILIQPMEGEKYNPWLVSACYRHFPLVMLDLTMPGIRVPFVGVDNRALSELAVEKLIEKGHTGIALLAPMDENRSSVKDRMDGFISAFAKHHLPVIKELWLTNIEAKAQERMDPVHPETRLQIYIDLLKAHFRAHPEITAVFGTEYLASDAARRAIIQMGGSVPETLSIVSFDSLDGDEHFAYIRQPQGIIAARGVEMLGAMIRGEKLTQETYLLEGDWVDGESIAAPRT